MKAFFIFAHPDDETFTSGGTIALLIKQGVDVHLLSATRGEEGEAGNPAITTKEELPSCREQELRSAAAVLGVHHVHFFDFRDGTLTQCGWETLSKEILNILEKETPDIVFTFDKYGGSNHPDHKTISRATTDAFCEYKDTVKKHVKLYHTATPLKDIIKTEEVGLGYSAFGKRRGVNEDAITTVVSIEETFDTKVAALRMHKTQHQDWERYLKRGEYIDLKKEYFTLICENSLV